MIQLKAQPAISPSSCINTFYFHTSTIRYFLLSSIKLIRKEHRIVKYTPRAHNLFATKTGTSVINTSKKLSFIIRECKRQITTKGILFYLLYPIASITIYYKSFPIIELRVPLIKITHGKYCITFLSQFCNLFETKIGFWEISCKINNGIVIKIK